MGVEDVIAIGEREPNGGMDSDRAGAVTGATGGVKESSESLKESVGECQPLEPLDEADDEAADKSGLEVVGRREVWTLSLRACATG